MPLFRSSALVATCLLLLVTLDGCATIFTGTHDDVKVESTPASATIVVFDRDGDPIDSAVTPHTFNLRRNEEKYTVSIKIEGYQESRIAIRREFNLWTLCNILCGGIIGGAIDFIDGAAWHLQPDTILATLVAVPPTRIAPTPAAPASAPPSPGGYTSNASVEGVGSRLYVVFYTRDDDGRLRMMAVPLVREQTVLAGR